MATTPRFSINSDRVILGLIALTTLFFVLLPRYCETHVTHTRYTLGWPFPADALVIGYMSPEDPSGLHLYFDLFLVLNAILWLAVLLGLRRLVQMGCLSRHLMLACIALVLLVGGAWFAFGVASVAQTLVIDSQ